MKSTFPPICLALLLFSSASFSKERPKIDFDLFSNIKPGVTTKENVKDSFGNADEIKTTEDGELWTYNADGYKQFSAFFKKASEILESGSWSPRKENKEQNLRAALARFPKAKWVPETDKWVHAHYFPDDCYFRDYDLGVTVHYRMYRKEVAEISIRPLENIRTISQIDPTEPTPKFCWGDDEKTCSNYTSGKQWQKKYKTCEPELKQALTANKKSSK